MIQTRRGNSIAAQRMPEPHPDKHHAPRRASSASRLPTAVAFPILLAAAAAFLIRPDVRAETEAQDYTLEWAFAGGGPIELGQCTQSGQIPVDVEFWGDAFVLLLRIPAGEPLPCLGSRLEEEHIIEVFGESLDGEVEAFLVPDVRWQLSISADHGPALELADVRLQPSAGGQYEVVWTEGPPKHFPTGLELSIRPQSQDDSHAEEPHHE